MTIEILTDDAQPTDIQFPPNAGRSYPAGHIISDVIDTDHYSGTKILAVLSAFRPVN